MQRILIIEDEVKIQEILADFLAEEGYSVDCASDGASGLAQFNKECYNLVLLDIMMPKVDGFSVLEVIRQCSEIPVIFITAMDSEMYQIKGFDLKADDYITKPFSMNLVMRRIHAVLRRSQMDINPTSEEPFIIHHHVLLDKEACEVSIDGVVIPFTYKEYKLLKLLMENKNKVFTREDILDHVWGYDYFGHNTVVKNHIMNIRKKLGEDFIMTVRGMGYKIGK